MVSIDPYVRGIQEQKIADALKEEMVKDDAYSYAHLAHIALDALLGIKEDELPVAGYIADVRTRVYIWAADHEEGDSPVFEMEYGGTKDEKAEAQTWKSFRAAEKRIADTTPTAPSAVELKSPYANICCMGCHFRVRPVDVGTFGFKYRHRGSKSEGWYCRSCKGINV